MRNSESAYLFTFINGVPRVSVTPIYRTIVTLSQKFLVDKWLPATSMNLIPLKNLRYFIFLSHYSRFSDE